MREITGPQIAVFALLALLAFGADLLLTRLIGAVVPPGDFRGILLSLLFVILFFGIAMAVYRVFLFFMPLEMGVLAPGSRGEFAAQVDTLFYLLIFNSLVRSHVLPVPLMRLVYIALGASLGRNTYSAGVIMDPVLTSAGDNCIIGHDAVVFCHAIEGPVFSLAPVRLGHNVTIGAMAVIMSDVQIGDGAIVSAGAVVTKGSRIGAGEVWGGIPARLLKPATQA